MYIRALSPVVAKGKKEKDPYAKPKEVNWQIMVRSFFV